MKIYIIGNKDAFIYKPPRPIDEFHEVMFHGYNCRGLHDNDQSYYFLHDANIKPSRLIKNTFNISDFFMPNGNILVVSKKIKIELNRFSYIEYEKVKFEKLLHYEYHENDFSYKKLNGYKDPYDFIKKIKKKHEISE